MDAQIFKELLKLTGFSITYQDINMWQAISHGERLALILHFLSTGNTLLY